MVFFVLVALILMLIGTVFNILRLDLLCVCPNVELQVQGATPSHRSPRSALGLEPAPLSTPRGPHASGPI